LVELKKIYWDSCVWISVINDEPGRVEICQYLLDCANKREVEIWTSSLTLAEVFKKKCGALTVAIDPTKDVDFETFIQQDFLVEVQVDHEIGVTARRLLRAHAELKKPMDAIHLATAVLNNVDEFHTFDGDNLLALNGKVLRKDGKPLHILKPAFPAGHQTDLLPKGTEAVVEPLAAAEVTTPGAQAGSSK